MVRDPSERIKWIALCEMHYITKRTKFVRYCIHICMTKSPLTLTRMSLCILLFKVVTGCVSSCEDHGYIIDLGVKGIYAFLKKAAADEYVQDYNDGTYRVT